MKIVFSGGGTGGHIYPALAIREALIEKLGADLASVYVGVSGGMEEKIVERIPELSFLGVRAQGMPRSLSLKLLSFPIVNFLGVLDAVAHLRSFAPDLVVTTGGYVAFPVLMAARLLGIPAIIHEQNAAMGVTNRLFAKSARRVLLTYASAGQVDNKKVFLTGNPVRKSFLEKSCAAGMFHKKPGEFWLLSVGGSRGALSLNKVCVELVKNWLPENKNVVLLHICGERDYELVKSETSGAPENYRLLPYLHEMKQAFDVADLVISRAGATILSELAVCKKPAILVPFPYATDNHQEKNARVLQDAGAARLILDSELSWEKIATMVKEITSQDKLKKMSEAMSKSRPADVESKIAQIIIDAMNE
ncbi:MAG: undecaprenyldiphospho-muramoylpentapeptide beta-N-acetylglucosaminyltransferase [Candidatus Rifleibacteriota bacterium]